MFEIQNALLREILIAGAYLAGGAAAAWITSHLLGPVLKAFIGRTKTTLDDHLTGALRGPISLAVILWAVHLAIGSVSSLDQYQDLQVFLDNATLATFIFVAGHALRGIVLGSLRWYSLEIAAKTKTDWDDRLIPILRQVVTLLVYSVAFLIALSQFGQDISPLLASLGIGGLAVALALQPTLSNFFAGAYTVADGSIKPGDFIELDSGPSGAVSDIGWRSTKIITPTGNMVIIPNSKLVDTIVTNFNGPNPEMTAIVACGVAYESNLERVEAVALEVAVSLAGELPDDVVVKTFEPLVRFADFGDSNINFRVIMRATNRVNTFLITHELVKRLHARFTEEKIEINYPVRKLVYTPSADQTQPLMRDTNGHSLN